MMTRLAALVGIQRSTRSPFVDQSHLERVTLEELYGLASQITVTRTRAMRVSVIAKGRRVIAGNIGRLKLKTTKGNTPAPLTPQLLQQPERDRPLAASLTWLADSLMFYPRAWWIVEERDSYGWPVWVKALDQADAEFDDKGNLVKAWGKPVAWRDVIEFQAIDDGLLHDAGDTIRRAIIIAAAASRMEENPVPALDLHNEGEDLDDNEISELLDSWMEARRKRGVGYSSKSLKVNPLGMPSGKFLIEGRQALDVELVRHIGLPAWAADVPVAGSSLEYDNRAAKNWELIDLGLSPIMTAITSRLSMPDVTPRGWTVDFDTDTLTRDDMKTRFETYQIGKAGGFITNDQIAAWEGWETTAPEETQ